MRRPVVLASLLAAAVLVSACSVNETPNWTFAPPTPSPSAGAAQSTAPSAAPSAAASAAAPSAGASAGSGGSGGATGNVIDLTAQGIAFQQTDLKAPANAPFTIHFDNQDASTIHNVVIKDGTGAEKFSGDLITGPAQADYQVPALPAGSYTFVCAVHPNMTGTLTVGP